MLYEVITFDDFSAANLSKYLIKETLKEGKTLVFLKPCDSYSLNQLVSEHRIKRERVYAIGVACDGKLDAAKAIESGAEAATRITSYNVCYTKLLREYRIEHDSMGEVKVPADKYWAAQTERSHENFRIGVGIETMPREITHAFGVLKKAAAMANNAIKP